MELKKAEEQLLEGIQARNRGMATYRTACKKVEKAKAAFIEAIGETKK